MRLLLDTATLIRAVESPDLLSRRAKVALESKRNVLELSSISLSEIAIKVAVGKLEFPAGLLREALTDLDVRVLPYTAAHAFALFDLPFHHRDPFDRQILAQVLVEEIPVVTPDDAFRLYKSVKVVW